MSASTLSRLERAIAQRNPLLLHVLQPGLTELEIMSAINKAGMNGDLRAILEVYHWRNGMDPRSQLSLLESSLFPKSIYQFLSLQNAIEMYKTLQQAADDLAAITGDPTGISRSVKQCFPLFWDGSNCSLGVGLTPGAQNPVVMINFGNTEPFCEVYRAFEEFLEDVARANEENDRLKCFHL